MKKQVEEKSALDARVLEDKTALDFRVNKFIKLVSSFGPDFVDIDRRRSSLRSNKSLESFIARVLRNEGDSDEVPSWVDMAHPGNMLHSLLLDAGLAQVEAQEGKLIFKNCVV